MTSAAHGILPPRNRLLPENPGQKERNALYYCTFQVVVYSIVYFKSAYHMGWIEKRGIMYYIWSTLGIAVAMWLGGMAMCMFEIEIINRKIKDKNRNK